MPDSFLFAPEVKSILQAMSSRTVLNEKAVADFLAFGEFFGEETFFEQISILRPASILTYEKERMSIEQYWKFEYVSDWDMTEKEIATRLSDRFRQAVEMQH
jgi:asparagine synthetase B (glutamine-hydrolysing)